MQTVIKMARCFYDCLHIEVYENTSYSISNVYANGPSLQNWYSLRVSNQIDL